MAEVVSTEVALDELDVSDPALYRMDAWRPVFARLRAEDPVHYHRQSPFGPYWSVTRLKDIMHVDTHHELFSSEPTIVIGDQAEDFEIDNFIQMDPPRHDAQRGAVMPVVAPRNLMKLEPVIRARLGPILDALQPGDELLFAGTMRAKTAQLDLLHNLNTCCYALTGEDRPSGWIWQTIRRAGRPPAHGSV